MARQYQFGEFSLDEPRYRLQRGDRVLRLEKRPMELLLLLVERRGELVGRGEIAERLWGKDVFVDVDHSINTAVRKVRQVLRDDPEHPRYVETVVGKGYRFTAPVECKNGAASSESPASMLAISEPVVPVAKPNVNSSGWWLAISALVLVLVAGGSWYRSRSSAKPAALVPIRSIVVLPLKNLSGDPNQEYLADGTTEELITMLAKTTDLRVISRTSAMRMKEVPKSVQEIGSVLGVDAVVEGSVARSPQTIRITAQLIDARSDRHLWAEEYEGPPDEIFKLQQRVALDIASHVSAKIAPQQEAQIEGSKPISPEAHDLYLKGRSFSAEMTPASLKKSVELYQQAIGLQSDYAAAYSAMAESYGILASGWEDPHVYFPLARDAALKALSLDNSIPGARITLAWLKHAYDWDTEGAETQFQTALKLEGYDATTHAAYADFLADIGRYDEGLAQARLAEDLDPLSLHASLSVERSLMRGRRFEEFLKQAERSRKLDPNSVPTTYHSIIVYENLGRFEDAIHEIETHDNWEDPPSFAIVLAKQLRAGLLRDGPKGYWRAALQPLLKPPAEDHWNIARCYLMLGNNEAGLRELELAVQQRDPGIRFDIKNSPCWDPVRSDPRFKQLLRQAGY